MPLSLLFEKNCEKTSAIIKSNGNKRFKNCTFSHQRNERKKIQFNVEFKCFLLSFFSNNTNNIFFFYETEVD